MAKTSPSRRDLPNVGADAMLDGNIQIERAKDGLSASLTFNTLYAISCKIAYYQDTGTTVQPSTLDWTSCTSPQPGRAFKETVANLKPDFFYVFAVKIWAQNKTEESAFIKVVRENAAPGDPTTRYMIRLDIPTKSAQVDSFASTSELEPVQKEFLTPFACKAATTERTLPGTRLASLPINRINSRGFFTGLSFTSEDLADGLLITGAALAPTAEEWVINVQSKTTSGAVRLTPPPQLKDVAISQSTTVNATENTLEDNEIAAFKVSMSAPLNISWTADRVAENSLAVITLTSLSKEHRFICGFDGKVGNAPIPSETLTTLGPGRIFLTVRLENIQMPLKDRWLSRTVDWRSLQVQIQ